MFNSKTIGLWVASGFGAGYLPKAPGTWGSGVGLLIGLGLTLIGSPVLYTALVVVASVLAIPLCTWAEKVLGKTDPAVVVIDEIVGVLIAFSGCIWVWWSQTGALPGAWMFTYWTPLLLLSFVLFRVFDIWKPGPIGKLQALPGGLGIVLDDVAAGLVAGIFVAGATWAVFWI